MSERMNAELESYVTRRLVTGIDVLPVPAGTGRLPPRRTAGLGSDVMPILAAVIVILAVSIGWASASHGVAEATKILQRMFAGEPLVGYYVDFDSRDAMDEPIPRIRFASGRLPGIAATPDLTWPAPLAWPVVSSWSADAEHVLVHAGSRIYAGDRIGQMREVADFGGEFRVLAASWMGARDVLAILGQAEGLVDVPDPTGRVHRVERIGDRRWIASVRIDGAQATPRLLPRTIRPCCGARWASPDGRWIIALRELSPGSTPASNACPAVSSLYDVNEDRIVDLFDARDRPLMAIGWSPDGRLVTALCDAARGSIELFVGPPEVAPTGPLAVLPWAHQSALPFVDPSRAQIVAAPLAGARPATLLAIDLDGRQTTLGQVPVLDPAATVGRGQDAVNVHILSLSRDGRYLSFGTGSRDARFWTGVVDLATRRVTYACAPATTSEAGCALLRVR